jgi:hypothetical protein
MNESQSAETKNGAQRGSVRKRISYAIAVVLTGMIAVAVYYQFQVLPRRISTYVNDHYLRGTNFQFSIDGMSGYQAHQPGASLPLAVRVLQRVPR